MKRTHRVLVFRIGQLGDTLVSVPALWVIRERFRSSQITLLADAHQGKGYVKAADVLRNSGIIDDFIEYNALAVGGGGHPFLGAISLLRDLRAAHYDVLVYLVPSCPGRRRTCRDALFFRLAGVKQFHGFREAAAERDIMFLQDDGRTLQEADRLLTRLAKCGFQVPNLTQGRVDVSITESEQAASRGWIAEQPLDGGRPWIAVGPGSKMPVKIWPHERYVAIVRRLIDDFDVWPVVFGGKEDIKVARGFVQAWGRGHVAAGALGIRETIAAMSRCVLFVGNDTGTMHMAVAAGVPCVAIFSARDADGKWAPYGPGHVVLRKSVPCAGCMREICVDLGARCITTITIDEVYRSCAKALRQSALA